MARIVRGYYGTCFDCGKEGHFTGAKRCKKSKSSSTKEFKKPSNPVKKKNKQAIQRVDSDSCWEDGTA